MARLPKQRQIYRAARYYVETVWYIGGKSVDVLRYAILGHSENLAELKTAVKKTLLLHADLANDLGNKTHQDTAKLDQSLGFVVVIEKVQNTIKTNTPEFIFNFKSMFWRKPTENITEFKETLKTVYHFTFPDETKP